MTVYYLLIVISFIAYISNMRYLDGYKRLENGIIRRNLYKRRIGKSMVPRSFSSIFVVSVLIFLIMGFRDFSVGADTPRYVLIFNEHLYGEGSNITTARTDWLYTVFNNFFSLFMTARIYILMLSLIFVVTITKFGIAETDNAVLFLFFYITIGTFSMNMTGIRQSLAICITFLAYHFAKRRHVLRFLILTGIAFLFHNSAIIFVLAYPIMLFSKKNSRKWTLAWMVIPIFAFLPFFPNLVIKVVQYANLTKFLQNLESTGINLKCFIFYYGLLCIITILNMAENIKMCQRDTVLFRMGVLGCACYGIAPNFYLFDRLAMYFTPFLIAYYVNSLLKLKNHSSRKLAILLCMGISVVWFVSSTINGSLHIDSYSFGL